MIAPSTAVCGMTYMTTERSSTIPRTGMILGSQPIFTVFAAFSSLMPNFPDALMMSRSTGSALMTRPVQTIHLGVVGVCGMDMVFPFELDLLNSLIRKNLAWHQGFPNSCEFDC